jgi:hypothetical protein
MMEFCNFDSINSKNKIMKTIVFIFLAVPFTVFGQCNPLGNGILKAEVDGNSVVLRNDTIYRNCACDYLMQISQLEGDTLAWIQLEQSGAFANCYCHFNLSITLDSLVAGNYYVKTFYTKIPSPTGDTCYIGLISFTITDQNSFTSYGVTDEYQSTCFSVGINTHEQPERDKMTIIPNPVIDKITISSTAITGDTHLSIFKVNGEKVLERQLTETETQIDISTLARGIYFIRLQNEKMVEVEKMVKE